MAVIVTIRVDPITGKSELVGSRLNQASEIWASKGATTRVAFISMGLNAGQFLFAATFEDFSSTMTAMESVYMDPAMQELMQQRECEPGGKNDRFKHVQDHLWRTGDPPGKSAYDPLLSDAPTQYPFCH